MRRFIFIFLYIAVVIGFSYGVIGIETFWLIKIFMILCMASILAYVLFPAFLKR